MDLHMQLELPSKAVGCTTMHVLHYQQKQYNKNRIVKELQVTIDVTIPNNIQYGDRVRIVGAGHQLLDKDANGDLYLLIIEPGDSGFTDPGE